MQGIDYKIPNIKELEAICDLNLFLFALSYKNFDETLDPKWSESKKYSQFFEKYFSKGNYILCAYKNGELIGYVSGSITKSPEYRKQMYIGVLENLMVLPEYQGYGIGKELTEYFIKWVHKNNCKRLTVSVYSKNTKALDFYKKFGFENYDQNLELVLK